MNYDKNKDYFFGDTNKKISTINAHKAAYYVIGFILVAISILLVSDSDGGAGYVICVTGAFVLVVAACAFYANTSIEKISDSIATDSDIDNACMGEIKNFEIKALDKLGLSNRLSEIEYKALINNYYFNTATNMKCWYIKGEDGKYRSNIYRATALYFVKNQLYIYMYIFSIIDKNANGEYINTINISNIRSAEIKFYDNANLSHIPFIKICFTNNNYIIIPFRDVDNATNIIQYIQNRIS